MLTHQRLISELAYDPLTGIFSWKNSRKGIKAGKVAGTTNKRGYVVIKIDRETYYAHILAVFYQTGIYPQTAVDHKNGNPSNNEWLNIRVAGSGMNNANARMRSDNAVGFKGVSRYKDRYQAHCKGKYLGLFDTPEEAHAAYAKEANAVFGEYARLQ